MVIDMGKINLFTGIVESEIFNEFFEQKGINLFNKSCNSYSIEDFLTASYVLCPDFIEVEGYIFLADLFEEREDEAIKEIRRLEDQFNFCKKDIEQWVNSRSFGDFFFGQDIPAMDNDKILEQFGKVLIYYWRRRLKEIFPGRNIAVEVGSNIMGEYGPTITVYEVD